MPGGSGVVLPFRPPLASGAPSAPGVIAAAAPIIIMSDKSDLKAELERKKQRLAQIREEKKRKEEERKKKEVDFQQKKEPTQEDSDLDRKRRETEALLQSIGISPEPPLVPTPMSPSPKSVSTPSEAGSQDSGDLGPVGRTLQWDTDPSVLQLQSDSELGRRLHKLGVSKITQVDFLPREVVSYSKETQTPLDAHRSEEDEEDEELVEPKAQNDSEIETQEKKQDVKEAPPRELTEEEKQQILHSEEFLIFFDRTIRVIERALAEDSDIFFDYSGRDVEDKDGDIQAGANLSFNRQFYDEHWSKHRVVTCMDWSLQYPELMVASYNNNEDAPHEPDGVALVWNMKFKKTTPEYVFHCQSSVMSVCFARFHPNLVVGGTYSGQIVLWDNRSHRRTPVQRTPLSAAAHTMAKCAPGVWICSQLHRRAWSWCTTSLSQWRLLEWLSQLEMSTTLLSEVKRALSIQPVVTEVKRALVKSLKATKDLSRESIATWQWVQLTSPISLSHLHLTGLSSCGPQSTTSRSTPLKTMPTMCTMSRGPQCIPRSLPAWTGWAAWISGT
ncbi:cytoplasmic dynein 1 intermediate chain 1 isoform X8 [Hemicordylus capensis]|uniref:cytoplasmic dynein 1 intermediate chain 1 isoform X8 n=1 Tax=Hemicordylus capensis TaxID=884348 RepID=UPI00230236E5|nr:cytoplasmic dynein 1 intermediate chain 1 isoform X8 [Hemicordylus capensis]XP_053120833.1 cytoplasmic dynein 1 intermediate chain 1 isoform X8 [Hemicordylus capensis]